MIQILVVSCLAVLKSPKNIKTKKAWSARFAQEKKNVFFAYKFKVNLKVKTQFKKNWLKCFLHTTIF